ncbi:transcriptional regulator MraZ [Candidatus Parcubacteria bacterium]|nr:MAG: transcriptional regulator MraZ [Candidatus Parcubacteria bacterium]
MFFGEFTHSIDSKGRVAIPAKFRKFLEKGAVVTKGLDNSLSVYPIIEWQTLAEKLAKLPLTQSSSRAFVRMMLAGAADVELDKQGRIVLPEYLRIYGGINKKVVIAGIYNRIEIWDSEKWQAFKSESERNSGEIAEKLKELGI